MRRFLRSGLLAVAFMLLFNGFAATGTLAQARILGDILDRMDSHYKALKSLKADVARAQENSQLGVVDSYEGKLVLLPGSGRNFSVRLDWSKPKVEILSVVKGQYVLFVPGIKRAYTGSSESKKMSDTGGNVLSTMSMSKAQLKANYDVQFLGQVKLPGSIDVWHLKLNPKTKAKYKFAELWVDVDGMPLQGKVTALNNDTDTFRLTNLQKNVSLNGKIFTIALPSKTEIIKS